MGSLFSALGPRFTFWFFRKVLTTVSRRSSNAKGVQKNVKIIRQNVETAYADASVDQQRAIIDAVVTAMPEAMAELMLQPYWRQHGEALTRHNLDAPWMQPYARNERQAIFVLGHFLGWEPNIMTLSRHLRHVHAAYAPPKNPLLEPFFAQHRLATGATWTMLPRDLKGLQARLAKAFAGGSSLLYVLDAPLPGPMLPFMGLTSPTTLRPYQTAVDAGVPIIPLKMGRELGTLRFWIEAQEPLFATGKDQAAVIDLATRMNDHYSAWIREDPTQWYWTGQFFKPNRLWQRRELARAKRRAAKQECAAKQTLDKRSS